MNVENVALGGEPSRFLASFGTWVRWFVSPTGGWLFLGLLLLTGLVNGCMTEQAQSDWRWRQYNPNWERSGPAEPYQWGVPFWRP
jgi:hypothetical protein